MVVLGGVEGDPRAHSRQCFCWRHRERPQGNGKQPKRVYAHVLTAQALQAWDVCCRLGHVTWVTRAPPLWARRAGKPDGGVVAHKGSGWLWWQTSVSRTTLLMLGRTSVVRFITGRNEYRSTPITWRGLSPESFSSRAEAVARQQKGPALWLLGAHGRGPISKKPLCQEASQPLNQCLCPCRRGAPCLMGIGPWPCWKSCFFECSSFQGKHCMYRPLQQG